MPFPDIDVITATIPRFREISGLSRSKIYEMLTAGELESIHVGARRLIVVDSYRRLVERQRRPTDAGAAATAGKS